MIKRTLYFGNPAYLHLNNEQLIIRLPEVEKNETLPEHFKKEAATSIPIEDIGIVVLDHKQITITQALLEKLLDNNCSVITCNETHHPYGLLLPLSANTLQSEKFRVQIDASLPLKKQLWQQTIKCKITNQAQLLLSKHKQSVANMLHWAASVKSDDAENHEARAAAYYWEHLFTGFPDFRRSRDGEPPNNLLNYGYAILRAVTARALVASGMLPTLGIHHHNRYNAYCLADDIMEPYRPYVDKVVTDITGEISDLSLLTKDIKARLLGIPAMDVTINGQSSPLMVGITQTTTSLYRCFEGSARKIVYPEMI